MAMSTGAVVAAILLVMPAKVITLEESGITLTLPSGWASTRTEKGPSLHPSATDPSAGALTVLAAPTPPELLAAPLDVLLGQGAEQFAAEIQQAATASGGAATFGRPETQLFPALGPRAGRFLVGASLDMDGASQGLELFVGMVVTPEWTFTLLGSWPRSRTGAFRAQADAVLQSFRVAAPKSDAALAKALAGCWTRSEGSTSGAGSVFVSETFTLAADGTYERRSHSSATVPGLSGSSGGDTRAGRWQALPGGRVILTTSTGERSEVRAARQGGKLVVGSATFLPCR